MGAPSPSPCFGMTNLAGVGDNNMQITVGIITVSDRASRGEYDDLGGPALKEVAAKNSWSVLCEAIVPDEIEQLQATIRSLPNKAADSF